MVEYFLAIPTCRTDLRSTFGRDALRILVDAGFFELADVLRSKLT